MFTFAVIPSAVFVAPLAVLAAVFPAAFAGLARGVRRWRAFLTVVSVNGTLAAAYFFARPHLPDEWWAHPASFAALLLAVVAVGFAWSGRRYRRAAIADPAVTAPPTRRGVFAVVGLTVAALLVVLAVAVVTHWIGTGSLFTIRGSDLLKLLFELPTRELTAAIVGLTAASVYLTYRAVVGRGESQVSMSGETVALGAMLLFGIVTLVNAVPRAATSTQIGTSDTAMSAGESPIQLTDAAVWCEAESGTEAVSGVCVTPDRVLFGGVKADDFDRTGFLTCVDRATGRRRWTYTDPELRTVYCTPVEVGGRVYCGEGLHTDLNCRLLCLDAATGQKIWEKRTASHTEGTPVVADGRVYFSAGDDGLYCVTTDGVEVWHHPGREQGLHVDSSVTLANGRVYCGSGYQSFAAVCLDAASGQPVWKRELPLRSFGQPLVIGKRAYYGLGTGNLSFDRSVEPEPGRPPETTPAGAVVCLDADTGETVWKCDLSRSVHTQMSADGRAVYAACRDGAVYALDRGTGKVLWRVDCGLPLTTGTATPTYTKLGLSAAVYVATPQGVTTAHDPASGKVVWSREIDRLAGRFAEVFSPAAVVKVGDDGEERQVYVPVTLTNRNNGARTAAVVQFVDRAR